MEQMYKESFLDRCFRYLSTCFGLGFTYAPGTAGSMFTTALHYVAIKQINPSKLQLLLFDTILILTLFVVGIFAITNYLSKDKSKKDPKEVILDEVIGQLISFTICNALITSFAVQKLSHVYDSKQIFFHITCLLFFRLFDIFKPWPINLVDKKITNAFGVIGDDVLAGLFAGFASYHLMLLVF
jgi:phosphatidylglycerophosphatase A